MSHSLNLDNVLLNTDSYKASHWLQYPPGTDAAFFYVESRGGVYDRTVFFGLQAILKDALARPVTHADIDDAAAVFAAHGEPFNAVQHQAMAMQESADVEPNSVLKVFQKGYQLNGRLLRPAMVVVSKAPAPVSPSIDEQA